MLIYVQNIIISVINLGWYNYILKQRNFILFLSIFIFGRYIYFGGLEKY